MTVKWRVERKYLESQHPRNPADGRWIRVNADDVARAISSALGTGQHEPPDKGSLWPTGQIEPDPAVIGQMMTLHGGEPGRKWETTVDSSTVESPYSVLYEGHIIVNGDAAGTYQTRLTRDTDGTLHIFQEDLELRATYQAAKIGDELFKAGIDAYRRMGVVDIRQMANIDVGGYAWAQRGFRFDNDGEDSEDRPLWRFNSATIRNYAQFLDSLSKKVPEDQRDRLHDAAERFAGFGEFARPPAGAWPTPKELANFMSDVRWTERTGAQREISMWPGKWAMLAAGSLLGWHGTLDIRPGATDGVT